MTSKIFRISKEKRGKNEKILLIINILIITSISLISYAVEENNTIEINTNKEQIKKGEEIELNIKIPSTEKPLYQNDDNTSQYNFEQITPVDSKVTYEPVLMANQKMKEYGIAGAGMFAIATHNNNHVATLGLSQYSNVVGAGDYFSASTGLLRSVDGGDTWRVLTTANNPNYEEWATNKGGYEVSCIGIDPRTGKVWLASGCYGYSTINLPYQE